MSAIASVLELNQRAHARLGIKGPYDIHKVVYSLFDDIRTDEEKRKGTKSSGFLYADHGYQNGIRRILMLSDRDPAEHSGDIKVDVRSKPVPADFLDSDVYKFRLIFNPVRRESKTGKVIPLRDRDDVLDWFARRSEALGFTVDAGHFSVDDMSAMEVNKSKGANPVIHKVDVSGMLRVDDHDAFARAFRNGVGRAKSFGCGLLQLQPIQ